MLRRKLAAGAVLLGALALGAPGSPAGAAVELCAARTAAQTGNIPWQLRQASGLTTVASRPGVLFTHNDRGIRDSAAPGEDVLNASVWAIDAATGAPLARFKLVSAPGVPIPYFDTEAISHDATGNILLADTGTNVDPRVVVALYRFPVPDVAVGQDFVEPEVQAEVIPVAYYASATTSAQTQLNVEAFAIDATGNAWFIPRKSGKPYAYVASADALHQASGTTTPAHAIRSSRLTVAGPMTDMSISPVEVASTDPFLVVKTISITYLYKLTGRTVATALAASPSCTVANGPKAKNPGHGEAIVARADGGFTTVSEGKKGATAGQSSAIWSFSL